MDVAEATSLIQSIATSVTPRIAQSEWYLFGSFLRTKPFPNDFDLLIVYRFEEDARYLRSYFRTTDIPFPMDLILLTVEEELEFNFIANQDARRIYPAQVHSRGRIT